MPVPASRTDLSTTASSNSPQGSEAVFPNLDNYLRTIFAFVRQNYNDIQTANTNLTTRVPAGLIVMWSGTASKIPSGWVLCNGSNGTPDLRNRFIVGAGSTYSPGATGGATSGTTSSSGSHTHSGSTGSHTLTLDQIPSHTHALATIAETGIYAESGDASGGTSASSQTTLPAGGGNGHSHTISSDGAHTHTVSTLPPYYALCYIMKT